MSSKPIHLTLAEDLLTELDKAAAAEYCSRSDYVRQAIVLRLKARPMADKEADDFLAELRQLGQK